MGEKNLEIFVQVMRKIPGISTYTLYNPNLQAAVGEMDMKAQTVDVKESMGRILCCTIFRPGGRKLLAKGHLLSEEDVRLLETEGLGQVWVTELEDGEVAEDDAVSQAAAEMGCGCLEIRLAAGGRANLFATEDCCVLVDDELLKQIKDRKSVV